MLSWMDILAHQERCRELRREADQERLIRRVLAGRETHDRLFGRALTWLGQRLVVWGWRLQQRYSAGARASCVSACESG